MPLIPLTAHPSGVRVHGSDVPPEHALWHGLGKDRPVIVMVHGYKFAPSHPRACPHSHILSLEPYPHCRKALSWPKALGITGEAGDGLVGIAFGWYARGWFSDAYAEAERAGQMLADVLNSLHQMAPDRPVYALAHSLGARVVLSAVPHLQKGVLRRILLLNPAEYAHTARRALESPAGRSLELVNVTSRENDLFDFMMKQMIRPTSADDMLGEGLAGCENAVTLQLDCDETLRALNSLGFAIAPAAGLVCHWSTYTRPGVFGLYRHLFDPYGPMDLSHLRQALPQARAPRWSRLAAAFRRSKPQTAGSESHQAAFPSFGGKVIRTITQ